MAPGQSVTPALARTFARTCGCGQISFDRPEILEAYRGRETATRALGTAALLQDAGAAVGANLLLVPENIGSIGQSLAFLEGHGFHRVVLLRPFGNAGGRWPGGWPAASDWAALRSALQEWVARRPAISLEIACGLSFLLDSLPPAERRARLAFGCAGGSRFVALRADGTLWPCSHLWAARYRLGHVLEDDLDILWRRVRRSRPSAQHCPAARLTKCRAVPIHAVREIGTLAAGSRQPAHNNARL